MKKYFKLLVTALIVLVVAPSVVFADSLCGDSNTCFQSNNESILTNGVAGPNSVVGNVQNVSVYYVGMEWSNTTFDWVFNNQTNRYEWDGTGELIITDASSNGMVTPALSWVSETGFEATSASFNYGERHDGYTCEPVTYIPGDDDGEINLYDLMLNGHLYTDSECTNVAEDHGEVQEVYMKTSEGSEIVYKPFSGVVPSAGRLFIDGGGVYDDIYQYYLNYNLVVDYTKPYSIPTQGDIIGHYTVTFTTH